MGNRPLTLDTNFKLQERPTKWAGKGLNKSVPLFDPKNAGFHARYILHLKERYHCDDISSALAHACRYHAYDCKAVERILAAKAAPRTLESLRNEQASKELRLALPQIKQRPLEEYGLLLNRNTQGENQ